MARVCLIDDDATQLEVRRLILEHAGHTIVDGPSEPADAVVMDLHIPSLEEGLAMIRQQHGRARICVLSGFSHDLNGRPEAEMVEKVLTKPVRTETLLKWLALLLCATAAMWGQTLRVPSAGDVAVELELSSPGSNWASEGREAALADVAVDGRFNQHVMVFDGAARHAYPAFLGVLAAGSHRVEVTRNARFSAPGSGLIVHGVRLLEGVKSDILAHAPVLYARANTIGKFTDIPLIVYAERLAPAILQYTVIFSNEDGGTATRALMARWGRTTDIEYVYRLELSTNRAIIQADGHKDIVFDGVMEGSHPVLIPTTDNNMVGTGETSAIRYQIAPVEVSLTQDSRESVMDRFPWSYRIAAQEMQREGKTAQIGDQRQYVMLETRITNQDSAVAAVVRLNSSSRLYSSNLGREPMAMERDGIIRTTVQLPPGTKPADVAEVGFSCIALTRKPPNPKAGPCTFGAGVKVLGLDQEYRPFPIAGSWNNAPLTVLNTGETVLVSR